MNKGLGQQIIELHLQKKTYREICLILGCSKGTVSFHCGEGQKDKYKQRCRKNRELNPIAKKLSSFNSEKPTILSRKYLTNTLEKIVYKRLNSMKPQGNNKATVEQVMNKIVKEPVCYLTGERIDLDKPKTYAFDHIIPVSQNGSNEIDNLGLCTKQANACKSNLNHQEFLDFCKKVLEHHGYNISK